MWLYLILTSCLVLSFYDLAKKASVRDNAVFPTLLVSTLSGFAAVSFYLISRGELSETCMIGGGNILCLLVKSVIVGASWTATYYALRTLPITCAAPIRATGPLWTVLGAILFFGELPNCVQSVGIACVLIGCFAFSRSAKHEGLNVWRDRSVAYAFVGTLLGSISALYDKHLIQGMHLPSLTVLWWFMGGMSVLYALAVAIERGCKVPRVAFSWRWTIPLVGILLALSDACYFKAVQEPDAMISILSPLRRSSVIITFLVGGAVFHEKNLVRKALALAIILAGVVILALNAQFSFATLREFITTKIF